MREVDFFLINKNNYYRCEVKLMGKGNPESADAIFARESDIFVADKLSDLNKQQAERLKVNWVELRATNGFLKFGQILSNLEIANYFIEEDLDIQLDRILAKLTQVASYTKERSNVKGKINDETFNKKPSKVTA